METEARAGEATARTAVMGEQGGRRLGDSAPRVAVPALSSARPRRRPQESARVALERYDGLLAVLGRLLARQLAPAYRRHAEAQAAEVRRRRAETLAWLAAEGQVRG